MVRTQIDYKIRMNKLFDFNSISIELFLGSYETFVNRHFITHMCM